MKKLYLGILASALLTSSALAHTPPPTPSPAPMVPAMTYSTSAYDWDGFYVGVGIEGIAYSDTFNVVQADIIAGLNITSGQLLFGLEGWIGGFRSTFPSSGFQGGASARVGYLVSPKAVIYLAGGVNGNDLGFQYATAGGGVEFAITDNLSIDFEYKYWMSLNSAVTGSGIGASLNWGF